MRRGLVMRQHHVACDKTFVDFSGMRPQLVDCETGEVTEVELFVAVLGASSYTYAAATRTQRGPDWIGAHVHAYEYFEGVTVATVCDQLKSGIARACRYEPQIQRTYGDMAAHYGTTVLPARECGSRSPSSDAGNRLPEAVGRLPRLLPLWEHGRGNPCASSAGWRSGDLP